MASLTIKINAAVRDVVEQETWFDPDSFGLRLSEAVAQKLSSGLAVPNAVAAAARETPTRFFQVNRGARQRLPEALADIMAQKGIASGGLVDLLRRFKRFAERQLVTDLAKTRHEDSCRSHLQTYLDSHGRSFREVPIGAGQADLLLFLPDTEEVIEAKVWRGRQNHDDGLEELSLYMARECLQHGYYVVFEFHKIDPITSDEETYRSDSVDTDVIFVHIPLTPPSKVAKERRRQTRGAR